MDQYSPLIKSVIDSLITKNAWDLGFAFCPQDSISSSTMLGSVQIRSIKPYIVPSMQTLYPPDVSSLAASTQSLLVSVQVREEVTNMTRTRRKIVRLPLPSINVSLDFKKEDMVSMEEGLQGPGELAFNH